MLQRLTKEIIKKHIKDMIDMSAQLHGDYWTEEHYLSELNRKWDLSYALTENNELLGFMIVSDKGEAHHLHRIVIKKEVAGKGYGKILLDKLSEDAKNNHKKSITLKVHPTNSTAIKVYEKYGYKKEANDGENFLYRLILE